MPVAILAESSNKSEFNGDFARQLGMDSENNNGVQSGRVKICWPPVSASSTLDPVEEEEQDEQESNMVGYVQNMISRFQQVSDEGSEASISDKTGRSGTASKRALVSPGSFSPGHTSAANGNLVENKTNGGNMMTASASPPKIPSYVKIACSVGGYNSYSAYGTSTTNNARQTAVIQKQPYQNGLPSSHNGASSPGEQGTVSEAQHDGKTCKTTNESNCSNVPNTSMPAVNGFDHTDSILVPSKLTLKSKPSDDKNLRTDISDSNDIEVVNLQPVVVNGHKTPGEDQSSGVLLLTNDSSSLDNSTVAANKDSQNVSTPTKDGHYFLKVMESRSEWIHQQCDISESYLDNEKLSEEVSGIIRATIGKAKLLTSKKFKQFQGLCDKNISQNADEPFSTTNEDLLGFWELISIQVDDVKDMFENVAKLKENGWLLPSRTPTANTPVAAKKTIHKPKSSKSRERSERSAEMAKAREEARRRLLQAKKAGRVRKASQSDKDEIEIFVPE